MKFIFITLAILSLSSCQDSFNSVEQQGTSLFGEPLMPKPPSDELLEKLADKETTYEQDPTIDNLIWYGRFMAYSGDYLGAIELYSAGIAEHPKDARLYRHRGHRYISLRKFDEAIADLTHASKLIAGTENEIEPDGMPNAANIPVSTLHGNIYYHLGLAHYLKHEWKPALEAYKKCLATSALPDNLVSATHWLYSITRRYNGKMEADEFLTQIRGDMPVIENTAYHRLCLFYKEELSEEALLKTEGDGPANDAILYGLGNWYIYNGKPADAKRIFEQLRTRDSWSSFGYIAAEADLVKL